ncbi:toll/interleukin-1 receptor domain-containing protein [Streptomyces sp. 039-1]|uniref:toll/interleukin-1 receptor domain-containing protein n=1 Tax=Streptomyces sp. 039-1 TaxID=2789263 RepID=UPI0039F5B6F1
MCLTAHLQEHPWTTFTKTSATSREVPRLSSPCATKPTSPPRGFLPPARDPQGSPARSVAVHEPVEPAGDVLGGQTWDVFISHASEDKEAVARPLRNALTKLGVTVWLDEAQIRIGHSLRRKIDEGIRASRFGIVVLSPPLLRQGLDQPRTRRTRHS